MTELPLISVIVPAYNAQKWLEDCCGSVFAQTYPNIELIIVDDGSTDETLSVARRIGEGRDDVLLIHTDNGGVCRARNTGLEAARGELITFLDADDALTAEALAVLYAKLVAENADIAVGWKKNMNSDGQDLGKAYECSSGVFCGTEALKLSLEDNPAFHSVWGKLYRKSAIGDIRFVPDKKAHEDSFFVFECLLKQPTVVVTEDIVIRYRLSENSASRSGFSDKFLDILYFAQRKRDIIEKSYPEFLPLSENMIVKANMVILWNLLGTNDKKYKDIQKKAIRDILDRKEYFKAALGSDAKLFWIVKHRLYGFYKFLHRVKRAL